MEHSYFESDPLITPRTRVSVRDLCVAASHRPVGYQIVGGRAGPALLIVGQGGDVEVAFRRILALPNLPWLRGTLSLMRLADKDMGLDGLMLDQLSGDLGKIDGTLHVNGYSGDAREVYWTILRFCSQYGMISGRGVPKRTAAPESLSSLVPEHSAL